MKEHLKNNWFYYFGGFVILLIILYEAQGKGDFNIFLSASKDLIEGKNIFEIHYNEWYHYYYDPLFALLLFPFTFLPLYAAKVIWLLLNVFFVYRLWKCITYFLPVSVLGKKSKLFFFLLSFFIVSRFLRDNFHLAQVTIFILFLTVEGLFQIENKKKFFGSSLIALGITIKLLPIVIIPYLIYRKNFKATIYILFFIALFIFLPGFIVGFDHNLFLLSERWSIINPLNQEHVLDVSERSFHSLTTLLSTLLIENPGDAFALPLKRNIMDISIDNLYLVINFARGIFVLFALYFLKSLPFTNPTSKIQKLYEISYILLIVPLIFPHQQHYAFFFAFPATTYLIYYMLEIYFSKNSSVSQVKHFHLKKILFISVISLIYLLLNLNFILGEFRHFYEHYKIVTYGALLLIMLLAVSPPKRLQVKETNNIF